MTLLLIFITFLSCVFVYHHVIYPRLITVLGKRYAVQTQPSTNVEKPRIGVMICAHNEQAFIAQKLFNLSALDYPSDQFEIQLVLDGCTDQTEQEANRAIEQLHRQNICVQVHKFEHNRGKIAGINYLIANFKHQYDVLVFTDVSAILSLDAMSRLALHFSDPLIGVVSGIYQFYQPDQGCQQAYWHYQNKLKMAESKLGAVIGVPGAMCAIRSELVQPIPQSAINDDFILAMQALCEGHRAIVDANLHIVEMEADDQAADFTRRARIGAGNFQQIFILRHLMSSKNAWLAFNFLSHKVLRGLMPLVVLAAIVTMALAAIIENHLFAQGCLVALGACLLVGGIKKCCGVSKVIPVVDQVNYVLLSYAVALMGIVKFCLGGFKQPWRRVNQTQTVNNKASEDHHMVTSIKRSIDIVGALAGILLTSPIMLLAMIAIKLDSKGSIFYQQLRVGQADEHFVELFYVYKFRSMFIDAESRSGAVWATKGDPRITRVGRFLRKTRIDELPQFINVLKGEMSLIGPRPERPVFYNQLETNIPYFSLRTYGIKPGISGLAQVMNGYDENIEGVKRKIGWDYAYALALTSPKQWLSMELMIIAKTIRIVLLGKGQ